MAAGAVAAESFSRTSTVVVGAVEVVGAAVAGAVEEEADAESFLRTSKHSYISRFSLLSPSISLRVLYRAREPVYISSPKFLCVRLPAAAQALLVCGE